jgi:hypothetical protein
MLTSLGSAAVTRVISRMIKVVTGLEGLIMLLPVCTSDSMVRNLEIRVYMYEITSVLDRAFIIDNEIEAEMVR